MPRRRNPALQALLLAAFIVAFVVTGTAAPWSTTTYVGLVITLITGTAFWTGTEGGR